jgi:hypothetical protein
MNISEAVVCPPVVQDLLPERAYSSEVPKIYSLRLLPLKYIMNIKPPSTE